MIDLKKQTLPLIRVKVGDDVRIIGENSHDRLVISEDGRSLYFLNIQGMYGSQYDDDCRFVRPEYEKEVNVDKDYLDAYKDEIFDVEFVDLRNYADKTYLDKIDDYNELFNKYIDILGRFHRKCIEFNLLNKQFNKALDELDNYKSQYDKGYNDAKAEYEKLLDKACDYIFNADINGCPEEYDHRLEKYIDKNKCYGCFHYCEDHDKLDKEEIRKVSLECWKEAFKRMVQDD